MLYLVIPAYEPNETLLVLLEQFQHIKDIMPIVVNDGSGEEKEDIFERAGEYAAILTHECNKGKGAALKTAFTYIKSLGKSGFIITADADGQHTKEDILNVYHCLKMHPDSFVTGVRAFKEKVPLRSKVGNTLTKYVFFLATGKKIVDTQCGLRGFPTSMLAFMLGIKGERYEYEMNMLLEAIENHPYQVVPIETIYIEENQSSHFHPIKDAFKIYKEIIKFCASSLISFFIDYISYIVLVFISAPMFAHTMALALSNIGARMISAGVNYQMNKHFVFGQGKKSIQSTGTLFKYIALASGILACNTGLLLGIHIVGLKNVFILKLLVESICFIISYLVQKHFIFTKKSKKREDKHYEIKQII